LETIIYVLLNVIFKIAILTQPFLPMASEKILSLLNKNSLIEFSYINTNLESGITLDKPSAVFPRFIKED
jgi:methionyl-tRNA synthetase